LDLDKSIVGDPKLVSYIIFFIPRSRRIEDFLIYLLFFLLIDLILES